MRARERLAEAILRGRSWGALLRWPLSGFPHEPARLSAPSRQSQDTDRLVHQLPLREFPVTPLHVSNKSKGQTQTLLVEAELTSPRHQQPNPVLLRYARLLQHEDMSGSVRVMWLQQSASQLQLQDTECGVLMFSSRPPGSQAPGRQPGHEGIGGVDSNRGLGRWLPGRVHVSPGPPKSVVI